MRYELWAVGYDFHNEYTDELFVGTYDTLEQAEAAAENLLGVDADWWTVEVT